MSGFFLPNRAKQAGGCGHFQDAIREPKKPAYQNQDTSVKRRQGMKKLFVMCLFFAFFVELTFSQENHLNTGFYLGYSGFTENSTVGSIQGFTGEFSGLVASFEDLKFNGVSTGVDIDYQFNSHFGIGGNFSINIPVSVEYKIVNTSNKENLPWFGFDFILGPKIFINNNFSVLPGIHFSYFSYEKEIKTYYMGITETETDKLRVLNFGIGIVLQGKINIRRIYLFADLYMALDVFENKKMAVSVENMILSPSTYWPGRHSDSLTWSGSSLNFTFKPVIGIGWRH
jgi:hypothetical protein